MQNSRFLQFVSKMSRGELIIDENQVKQASAPGEWATEYEQQYLGPPSWADQFANEKVCIYLMKYLFTLGSYLPL